MGLEWDIGFINFFRNADKQKFRYYKMVVYETGLVNMRHISSRVELDI